MILKNDSGYRSLVIYNFVEFFTYTSPDYGLSIGILFTNDKHLFISFGFIKLFFGIEIGRKLYNIEETYEYRNNKCKDN